MDAATPMNTRFDMTIPISNNAKMQGLIELLRSFGSVAIGFSGGVDSTFLAAVSIRALPPADVHLIHLDTPFVGTPERKSFERERERFERAGAHVVAIETDPLADLMLPPTRQTALPLQAPGIPAHRGRRVRARGARRAREATPMTPETIAPAPVPCASSTWSWKPAGAKTRSAKSCTLGDSTCGTSPPAPALATRIPCGEALTAEKLHAVRMCEDYLHGLGLRQVRVRIDGGMWRASVGAGERGRHHRAGVTAHIPMRTALPCGHTGAQARGCWTLWCTPYRHG